MPNKLIILRGMCVSGFRPFRGLLDEAVDQTQKNTLFQIGHGDGSSTGYRPLIKNRIADHRN